MATTIKTVITYPINGSTRDFTIPFEYLARKFVQVTLIGVDRKPLSNIDDYRFTTKNQITTNKAWGTGDGYQLIEIRRYTSATERLVDFSDGSILRAYDLNVSQIQTLHVAEEARDLTADTIGVNNDGNLDARGRRIINLADPVNDLDAVNLKTIKEWNDGVYQSYLKAKEQADLAFDYRNAAQRAEANANNSATEAFNYRNAAQSASISAQQSATSAEQSNNSAASSSYSASTSASSASASQTAASQSATKAYNEAERAKGYADSMGNAIDIGKTVEQIYPDNRIHWKAAHYMTGFVGSKYNETTFMGLNSETGRVIVKREDTAWLNYSFPKVGGTFALTSDISKVISYGKGTLIHSDDYTARLGGGDEAFYVSTKAGATCMSVSSDGDMVATGYTYRILKGGSLATQTEIGYNAGDTTPHIAYKVSGGDWNMVNLDVGSGRVALREWVNGGRGATLVWSGSMQAGNTRTANQSLANSVCNIHYHTGNTGIPRVTTVFVHSGTNSYYLGGWDAQAYLTINGSALNCTDSSNMSIVAIYKIG